MVLIFGLVVAGCAFMTGVLIVSLRDLISDSDCVGTCIGSVEYNALWTLAIAGGAVFVVLFTVATARAILLRHKRPAGDNH